MMVQAAGELWRIQSVRESASSSPIHDSLVENHSRLAMSGIEIADLVLEDSHY